MFELKLDMYQAAGIAAIMFWIGSYLQRKIAPLHKYCIPAPLIGGVVFAAMNTILSGMGVMRLTFDGTLQSFFMVLFFTTVGFTASFDILKRGGKQIIVVTLLSIAIIVCQDLIGYSIAGGFGLDSRLGLTAGSISLLGGPGTAAAFGKTMEDMGISGSTTLGLAAATFGLVMGSLMGGPIAHRRIARHNLHSEEIAAEATAENVEIPEEDGEFKTTSSKLVYAWMLMAIAMGLGTIMSILLSKTGITFPAYIGAMLGAALIRNVLDMSGKAFPEPENDTIANVSLSLFLTMALMGLKLWELVDLALPMLVILVAQMIFMFLFAYWVIFYTTGRNYESTLLMAGIVGYGMGGTSNAMANMQTITKQYGPAKTAYFVIPLGGMFSDFFNAMIITAFLNF